MKLKNFICLLMVVCLAVSLCACAGGGNDGGNSDGAAVDGASSPIEGNKLTSENVVGTGWQCTYHDNDKKIYTRFILSEDGTYDQIIAIDELFDHREKGTYEVKGGKLYLYLNGDTSSSTVYEYKKGNLLNSGNQYTPYYE